MKSLVFILSLFLLLGAEICFGTDKIITAPSGKVIIGSQGIIIVEEHYN